MAFAGVVRSPDRPKKKPPTEMSEGFFYTMGNLQLVIGNESLPQLPTL